ncbi:DUF1330 domain-containing protein [Roseomonas rosulenta]|uniref:DUF1330 domain-containing protein n=1 Tax=Roseomonas rosulenta TaxID=2748667 RepID=UPI0018DFEA2E|nr:DUF1330 domain-containing protein [Roseomonas rosulenta]
MKAYVIAVETIHDDAMFAEYRGQVMPTLAPFGASFVVRGGTLTVLEGDWPHQRTVIIEFPSRAAAEGWYASPAYQAVIGLRQSSSTGSLVIVDGPA